MAPAIKPRTGVPATATPTDSVATTMPTSLAAHLPTRGVKALPTESLLAAAAQHAAEGAPAIVAPTGLPRQRDHSHALLPTREPVAFHGQRSAHAIPADAVPGLSVGPLPVSIYARYDIVPGVVSATRDWLHSASAPTTPTGRIRLTIADMASAG